MSVISAVLFGALGALAPGLLRLYESRDQLIRFRLAYFSVTGLLAILAGTCTGLLAVSGSITDPLPAVLIGISVTSIVSTLSRLQHDSDRAGGSGRSRKSSRRESADLRDLSRWTTSEHAAETLTRAEQQAKSGVPLYGSKEEHVPDPALESVAKFLQEQSLQDRLKSPPDMEFSDSISVFLSYSYGDAKYGDAKYGDAPEVTAAMARSWAAKEGRAVRIRQAETAEREQAARTEKAEGGEVSSSDMPRIEG